MFRITVLLFIFLFLLLPCAEAENASPYSVQEILLERDGMKIYGELYRPETEEPLPLVIMCHGFGGNHEFMKPYMAAFAKQGIAVYAFDFIGGGYGSKSGGTMREMSVLTEAADLCAVIDAMKTQSGINPDGIFLLGASQGGFVASYVAGIRPEDVAGLVCLYPAYVLQDNAWKQTPDPDNIPDTISLMGTKLGGIYNRDAMSFDIYDVIRNYPGKVLIIHVTADFVVPVSYSERAAEVFPDAELMIYKGANHGFWGDDLVNSENQSIGFVREILSEKNAGK